MHSLCVFCGSATGTDPRFADTARALGRACAERGIAVVYGGASVGLMGILADAAIDAGGRVIGVLPHALATREIGHARLTQLELVDSMAERKQRMAELADAFVAIPGGIGTMDELFEVWTWEYLGVHEKPCAVLNVGGFYDHLLAWVQHAEGAGLVKPVQRAMLRVADTVADLFTVLDQPAAPHHRFPHTPEH